MTKIDDGVPIMVQDLDTLIRMLLGHTVTLTTIDDEVITGYVAGEHNAHLFLVPHQGAEIDETTPQVFIEDVIGVEVL